jgi:hypothetical protein
MIAPISHKSGYTYLGSDEATQRQRLLEGSAKTPRMETGARVIGHAARPRQKKHRRYEFVGWEFKPDKRGVRKAQPAGHRSSSLDGLFGNRALSSRPHGGGRSGG